jgi:hypothetical protein
LRINEASHIRRSFQQPRQCLPSQARFRPRQTKQSESTYVLRPQRSRLAYQKKTDYDRAINDYSLAISFSGSERSFGG